MAVAWIGNRETLVTRAAEHAAELLRSSRCPVFSFDTDIHGTRTAIALAEAAGAAYDHRRGEALAREAALFTGKGGLTASPGEVRRRADLLAMVGELAEPARSLAAELAGTAPDLAARTKRALFSIGVRGRPAWPGKTVRLGSARSDPGSVLSALRAALAGRQTAAPPANLAVFSAALQSASFPVFLFSGSGLDPLAMEMLQGLVDDLNRKGRASSLFLPASESGWGSTLASGWMTGFPPRTGFARGKPEFDPWRYDVERMIAAGEADLHLAVLAAGEVPPKRRNGTALLALAVTERPVRGAAITFAVGEPGLDHDAVGYSLASGTLAATTASARSDRASAAETLRLIAGHLQPGEALPC